MANTDESFQNSFVVNLTESYFKDSGDIMPKNICHQNIRVVPVTWPES